MMSFALILGAGLLAILYGVFTIQSVMALPAGNDRMKEIAAAIQEGAQAYLNRQYTTIAIAGAAVFAVLILILGLVAAGGFAIGAILSGVAGYVGMLVSVRANVRTTEASSQGLDKGLSVAFRAGAVTGMLVAGFALIGLAGYYALLTQVVGVEPESRTVVNGLVSLSLGASLISVFARLGGGIFTKGADVGGDMVGKVEAGIPEDDPRNPATIADNVGDNVGDCAGMAADLFETYVVTIAATMVLGSILYTANAEQFMLYPLAIGAACIVTSIIGTFAVRLNTGSTNVMGALYKGLFATGILSVVALGLVTSVMFGFSEEVGQTATGAMFNGTSLFLCGLLGLAVTGAIVWMTEYYTGTAFPPVKSVAAASETGHGTNVIQGLAVSMEATAGPALVIVVGIIAAYNFAGLYGIATAVTTMLALAGMIVALDAFGPVTDNAGGIAEMSGLEGSVRETTDALDAVGNTTKAVTKGYAIGSAGLGALVLFAAYTEDINHFVENPTEYPFFADVAINFSLSNPYVVVGLFFGGLLPYLFGSMAMQSVGRAAGAVVEEVRAQFRENPGIMQGTDKPNYGRAVDMLTRAAIKEMVVPSMLPILSPLVLYFTILLVAGKSAALSAVGAMLMGVIVTGLFVALSMTAGGGARTTPRNTSKPAIMAARARKPTKPRSPATRWAIRTKIRRARRSIR